MEPHSECRLKQQLVVVVTEQPQPSCLAEWQQTDASGLTAGGGVLALEREAPHNRLCCCTCCPLQFSYGRALQATTLKVSEASVQAAGWADG